MSWWTKNRKKVGLAAALLGAGAATVASGGTAAAPLAALFNGGMMAAPVVPEVVAATAPEVVAAAAAPEVAAAAAPAVSQGMFSMVPGVTNGSVQAQMLAAQNAGLGGSAADLTAQAAQTATGKAGFLDSIVNTAKADLAGMNDPSVWMDRIGRNAGRLAGTAGKDMAKAAALQAIMGPQGGSTGAPPPPMPAQMPAQAPTRSGYGSGGAGGIPPELQQLLAQLSPEDVKRLLEQLGGRV